MGTFLSQPDHVLEVKGELSSSGSAASQEKTSTSSDGVLSLQEIQRYEKHRRVADLVVFKNDDFNFKLDILENGQPHLQFCLTDEDSGKFNKKIVVEALDVLLELEDQLADRGYNQLFFLCPALENKLKIMQVAGFDEVMEYRDANDKPVLKLGRRDLVKNK